MKKITHRENKKCGQCKIIKPIREFYSNKSRNDGVTQYCKPCCNSRLKIWNKTHREYINNLQRKWSKRNRKKVSERLLKYVHKYPEKYRAHWLVRMAIKRNNLKKENCAICDSINVHAHHEDYDYPLDVVWLCPLHHKNIENIKLEIFALEGISILPAPSKSGG